jgi:hypothetical protein
MFKQKLKQIFDELKKRGEELLEPQQPQGQLIPIPVRNNDRNPGQG